MYYVYKACGYVLPSERQKGRLDSYDPPTVISRNWKEWLAVLDLRICKDCEKRHGKIYSIEENPEEELPLHPNCRCHIATMKAVYAGDGTNDGKHGADWWIRNEGRLPEYYITFSKIKEMGWKPGESPAKYAPGRMLTRGVYHNDEGHLPDAAGRVWFEADINYYEGKRNKHRLIWSNDGLIFATYNHYKTYMEIIRMEDGYDEFEQDTN